MSAASEQKIKIIHADDHRLIRTGVKNYLSQKLDLEFIDEAENGLELLNKLLYNQPDVVILNIQMPVMDGLKALPIIKERYPNIKVIILSMHNDPGIVSKMMELGANAYLTKEMGGEEIYEAILGVSKNDFYINDLVRHALAFQAKIPYKGFTQKEVIILGLLRSGKTTQQIANEIDLSPRTVDAIVDKLINGKGVKSVEELLEVAKKEGVIE